MKIFLINSLIASMICAMPIIGMDISEEIPTTDYILTVAVKSIPIVCNENDKISAVKEIERRLSSTNYMPAPIDKCTPALIKALSLWREHYDNSNEVHLRNAINALIQNDIQINQIDKEKRQPLNLALKAFRCAIVNKSADKEGVKIVAVEDWINTLIKKTTDINRKTIKGRTALIEAFSYLSKYENDLLDRANLLHFNLSLIERGADITIGDNTGYSLIKNMNALCRQFSDKLTDSSNISNAIEMNNQFCFDLMENILKASKGNSTDSYFTQLDKLIDKICEGETPSVLLVDSILSKVLEYETDLNSINDNGQTPLVKIIDQFHLVYNEDKKVNALFVAFKSIIKKGADVNYCYDSKIDQKTVKITALQRAKNYSKSPFLAVETRFLYDTVVKILKDNGAKEMEETGQIK